MINTNMSVNKYKGCTKDYIWNPSTYVCENSKYLKSAIDESAIAWDEILNATGSVQTNMTNVANTIPIDVTSSVSINCDY